MKNAWIGHKHFTNSELWDIENDLSWYLYLLNKDPGSGKNIFVKNYTKEEQVKTKTQSFYLVAICPHLKK